MAKDERFTQPHAGDSPMMGMENLEECVCARVRVYLLCVWSEGRGNSLTWISLRYLLNLTKIRVHEMYTK